jgi:hypothetical protein
MAGVGRNGPCDCGSGRKAKRCCGLRRGPSARDLDKAFLAAERRSALRLVPRDRRGFDELFHEAVRLPELEMSVHLRLPRLLSPELERLRAAIDAGDDEEFDDALAPALARVDTPERRAELARAVLVLRVAGRITARVAAMAMLDLTTTPSALLRASLGEALAVSVGAARTPAGLLVAAR